MTAIKTAISIQAPLLKKADQLAQELDITRSRLFCLAVETYLDQVRNQALLEKINKVHEVSDHREKAYMAQMKKKQRKLAEDAW